MSTPSRWAEFFRKVASAVEAYQAERSVELQPAPAASANHCSTSALCQRDATSGEPCRCPCGPCRVFNFNWSPPAAVANIPTDPETLIYHDGVAMCHARYDEHGRRSVDATFCKACEAGDEPNENGARCKQCGSTWGERRTLRAFFANHKKPSVSTGGDVIELGAAGDICVCGHVRLSHSSSMTTPSYTAACAGCDCKRFRVSAYVARA